MYSVEAAVGMAFLYESAVDHEIVARHPPCRAPNEKAAEAAAVAEFELSDEQRRRLVVQERN